MSKSGPIVCEEGIEVVSSEVQVRNESEILLRLVYRIPVTWARHIAGNLMEAADLIEAGPSKIDVVDSISTNEKISVMNEFLRRRGHAGILQKVERD